ncbi:MAG: inositol monophosphatase, partial [Actinomyces sp.]
GALIAAEAGARVLDRSQAGGAIVAATPGIFEELSTLLETAGVHEA